jgi:hypothetical protein
MVVMMMMMMMGFGLEVGLRVTWQCGALFN